ncbi:MAG: 3'-5' exonuclease [Treponema sp.]|nr:3'-5' exonuclease [Treponema sp.]
MQHPNRILKDFKKMHLLYEAGAVFTAIDTETTSITPKNGRIMEIGAVKFDKDGIISTFNQLFNPQCIIPPFVSQLTGITQRMVITSPLISEKLPDFIKMIENTILIAHNAQFDLNFINAECIRFELEPTGNKAIDTLQFSRWFYPSMEKHKLDYLAQQLKIDSGHSHRTYDDANACMHLFVKMCTESKD